MTLNFNIPSIWNRFSNKFLREIPFDDLINPHFLILWSPIFIASAIGLLIGFFIARGDWHFALVLVLIVPICVVFVKYPFIAILIWLLVFPFFYRTANVNERYIYWLLHRAMIPITLFGTIILNWGRIWKVELKRFRVIDVLMVLFLIYGYANINYLSKEVPPTLIKFYDLVFIPFCLYWLVRLINPNKKDMKRLVWVAIITVIIQAGISMLSWYMPGILPGKWRYLEGVRTVGTFGNPAVYTSTIMFLSLLFFSYAMHSKPSLFRNLLIMLFGLSIFSIVFSFSRDSWLALIIVLIGLTVLYPRIMLPLLAVLAIIAIIIGGTLFADELIFGVERFSEVSTAEDRIVQIVASLRMIEEKPLFGWGYFNFDYFKESFKTRVGFIENRSRSTSHNTFLSIFAEMGVIGIFLYMLPMVWWLWGSLMVWKKLPNKGWMDKSWLLFLWLFLIYHFTVNNFIDMIRFHSFGIATWWLGLAFVANIVTRPDIENTAVNS